MKTKSFEEAMTELESVVNELENENLSLDKSMEKFQKGIELSNYCNTLLDDAEKKITVLIEKNDGTMKEEKFELEKEENAENDDME